MVAEVKRGRQSMEEQVQGIKLFGKTIFLQVKKEELMPKATVLTNNTDHHHRRHRSQEQHHDEQQDEDEEEDQDDDDQQQEMKRPDKIIPCPRCKSMETKFCYFNNYNVNQPRHFCKGCQRYWTAGGALRNVPVGAGRRKSKPPGRGGLLGLAGVDGYPGNCIYDASGMMHHNTSTDHHQFDLDGVMIAEWQFAAATAAAEAGRSGHHHHQQHHHIVGGVISDGSGGGGGGGFQDGFPANKRRRSSASGSSIGQTC